MKVVLARTELHGAEVVVGVPAAAGTDYELADGSLEGDIGLGAVGIALAGEGSVPAVEDTAPEVVRTVLEMGDVVPEEVDIVLEEEGIALEVEDMDFESDDLEGDNPVVDIVPAEDAVRMEAEHEEHNLVEDTALVVHADSLL